MMVEFRFWLQDSVVDGSSAFDLGRVFAIPEDRTTRTEGANGELG